MVPEGNTSHSPSLTLSHLSDDLGRITAGEMAVGTPPPRSSGEGTGLWFDKTGLYGLNDSVKEATLEATTGKITAGAGKVRLGQAGILVFSAGTVVLNRTLDDGTTRTLSDDTTRTIHDELGVPTGLIEPDGDVSFGSNLSTPATTGFQIFSNAQNYNGEAMGAGDMLLGDNSANKPNILWDASVPGFLFRQGTVVMNYMSALALIQAGAKASRLSGSPQTIAASVDTPIQFNEETYDDEIYINLGSDSTKITIPANYGGRYTVGFYTNILEATGTTGRSFAAWVRYNEASTVCAAQLFPVAGNSAPMSSQDDYVLNAGDYLKLHYEHNDSVSHTVFGNMWIRRVEMSRAVPVICVPIIEPLAVAVPSCRNSCEDCCQANPDLRGTSDIPGG